MTRPPRDEEVFWFRDAQPRADDSKPAGAGIGTEAQGAGFLSQHWETYRRLGVEVQEGVNVRGDSTEKREAPLVMRLVLPWW